MSTELFPRTLNLHAADVPTFRLQLSEYFCATFDRYESLFATLANDDAYFVKAISLRHPLIFYFGHTATFFVNKLLLTDMIRERVDSRLESIFAVGVDEMSWDDLNSAHYDWPSVAEVKAYRDSVRELVLNLIDTAPLDLPVSWDHPWWAIVMGIEHERIHLETSSVLIRQHCLSRVKPHAQWPACKQTGVAPVNALITVPAGSIAFTKTHANPYYGWDNEYGSRTAEVAEFQASRYLVSNQEFFDFVEDGGYQNHGYWSDEGSAWQKYAHAEAPAFWVPSAHGWRLRLMTEEVAMPWDWPAEVNYHEAKAFCNWKTKTTGLSIRMPTEDEWYRLCSFVGLEDVADERAAANIQLDHFASSCPVNMFAQGALFDVTGNVWQWTETPIYPLPGFEVHPIYDDFTAPTIDEQHNLIKGGSWISSGNLARLGSRYAFRRHFFQHAGFRYVVAGDLKTVPASHYETDKLLAEYAEFHYGDEYFGVANFSKALVEAGVAALADRPRTKALDIGCASGRATFELARYFERATGIDFSARFIGQGTQLVNEGILRYTLTDEGELVSYKSRSLSDLALQDVSNKVEFFQGDACNLKPEFKNYDFILAANLIDRLYSPTKFLASIHERLNMGGVLLLASPYTWLQEHTPREEWIGAFKKDGESFTTLDGLTALLGEHFKLIQAPQEVPFVIRETKRKFQHSLSEVSLWERVK